MNNQLLQLYKDMIEFGVAIKVSEVKYVKKCLYQAFLIGKLEGIKAINITSSTGEKMGGSFNKGGSPIIKN